MKEVVFICCRDNSCGVESISKLSSERTELFFPRRQDFDILFPHKRPSSSRPRLLPCIMADDGMLLNFTFDDCSLNIQRKFKGGRWKDRLTAKKVAQHRQQKRISSKPALVNGTSPGLTEPPPDIATNGSVHEDPSAPRPAKRRKTSVDFQSSSTQDATSPAGDVARVRPHPHGKTHSKPREVVSSLFSYNPTSTTVPEKPADEAVQPSKPSNAPLIDGLDTFTSLGLSPTLAAHLLTKLELKAPTAIQKSAMSQLLQEDSDAFIQAETGSGKTLAYLLPLVQRIMDLSRQKDEVEKQTVAEGAVHRDSGLFAVILAPTRELCKQISVVLESLLRCAHWIVAGTVIGGEKKKSEKARLRKGLNILVATPGRLADHLDNTKVLDVSNVRWLVFDEGDRLMDLGFEDEIQGIVKKLDERQKSASKTRIPGLPTRRTTVLCSATMRMNVQRLGEISLKDAVHIKADVSEETSSDRISKTSDSIFSAPAQLKQSYTVVAAKLRLVTLAALIKRTFARKGSVMKAIVFVSCADSVDFHFEVFTRKVEVATDVQTSKSSSASDTTHSTISSSPGFSTPSNPVILHKLHGSLPQNVRTATLSSFAHNKDASLLICTDVASRGLDVPNVDLIVEFDPPFSAEEHLHRIGRTARAGRDGRALIFLLPGDEEGYVEVLKGGYRDGGKSLVRTDANEIMKRCFGRNVGAGKDWEDKATEWQLEIERWALEQPRNLEMARRAFQSHVRAYATHIASERNMFNIQNLHLGHLAKSFALRDRPGNINVPGLRQGTEETTKAFKAERRTSNAVNGEKRKAGARSDHRIPRSSDDASRRMRAKMKEHMAGANEFNIA